MAEWGETMPMAWGDDDDGDRVAEQSVAADSQSTVCATGPTPHRFSSFSFGARHVGIFQLSFLVCVMC